MWLKTLEHIVHTVKTAFGITNESYKYTEEDPIYGPGQGSQGSPAGWNTTSFPLIKAMEKLAKGLRFCDPYNVRKYFLAVVMFIDDATNSCNDFRKWLDTPPEEEEVLRMLQADAQRWERLLWSSGGLLRWISACITS